MTPTYAAFVAGLVIGFLTGAWAVVGLWYWRDWEKVT